MALTTIQVAKNQVAKNRAGWILLASVLIFSSCSKKKSSGATTPTAPTPELSNPRDVDNSGNSGDVPRYCTTKLNISSSLTVAASRLAEFFQNPVNALEGDPTVCFRTIGYGTYQQGDNSSSPAVQGAVRIEYEDHYGVSALEFNNTQNVFYGKVAQSTSGTSFEVIFMDGVGFLQVKGSGSSSLTMTLKYHNFPSMEQYLKDQLATIQQKCKNGTYTVAQCLGYNWPSTYWWNQPAYVSAQQQQLDMAHAILNDTSKTKVLGTAVVNVADIIFR